MVLKERLEFPTGPAKLIYECTANPNHVNVIDAVPPPSEHPTGEETLPSPIDLIKELGQERITRLLLSPDHSTLTVETESGNRLLARAREGGKLRIEFAPKPPEQPPLDLSAEADGDARTEST